MVETWTTRLIVRPTSKPGPQGPGFGLSRVVGGQVRRWVHRHAVDPGTTSRTWALAPGTRRVLAHVYQGKLDDEVAMAIRMAVDPGYPGAGGDG